MQIEFNQIVELCNQTNENLRIPLKFEILEFIQIKTVEKYKISSTIGIFQTHQKIQNEITYSDAVEGYENLLERLTKEYKNEGHDFEVFQIDIISEKSGYLLFSDINLKILYGILKFNKLKINRDIEINEDGKLKGKWLNSIFFLNGKEIK
jgi:hypothetical protein